MAHAEREISLHAMRQLLVRTLGISVRCLIESADWRNALPDRVDHNIMATCASLASLLLGSYVQIPPMAKSENAAEHELPARLKPCAHAVQATRLPHVTEDLGVKTYASRVAVGAIILQRPDCFLKT